LDDRETKVLSEISDPQIDTLGLDDEDNKSEIRTLGYEAYLKAQGIILEPGNEFESMVGL
jgi:hypothetical protein